MTSSRTYCSDQSAEARGSNRAATSEPGDDDWKTRAGHKGAAGRQSKGMADPERGWTRERWTIWWRWVPWTVARITAPGRRTGGIGRVGAQRRRREERRAEKGHAGGLSRT